MNKSEHILVFSENRDTKSIYESFGRSGDFIVQYAAKDTASFNILMLQKFALIVVEIMYPSMTEIEFVENLHKFERDTPIIVISSYFYETKDILFGDKIAAFIHKPFTFEILHREVDLVTKKEKIKKEEKAVPAALKDPDYELKKLSVLLEISKTINAKTKIDELLSLIVKLTANAFDCERGTVFVLDREKKELWSKVGTGLERQEIRLRMDRGIAGLVAAGGSPIMLEDAYANPKFNRDIDASTGFKTRNILCVPMKNLQGEIIGVFQLLNKHKDNFIKQDEEFLTAIAASTGVAIENALLTEKLRKQAGNASTDNSGKEKTIREIKDIIEIALNDIDEVDDELAEKIMREFNKRIKKEYNI
jgi:DNA-binding response OmpR family regulator